MYQQNKNGWKSFKSLGFIFLCLFTFKIVLADCARGDITISNLSPFVMDFNAALTQPVNVSITHGPFSGSRRCVYAVVADYGRSNNFSNRRLESFSTDQLSFNVHKNLPTSNANILRDVLDVTSNNQILISPHFNASPSSQTQIKTFYANLPSVPTILNPGIYLESLVLKVVARPANNSSSGVSSWPVVAERSVSFLYFKPSTLEISIVDSGQALNNLDKSQLMSFGKLSPGLIQTADVMVDTNVGYRLYVSSRNDGVLSHQTAADVIPYDMTLNGANVNLSGSSLSPVNVVNQSNSSPVGGYRLPVVVTIGAMTNNEQGGSYSDTIVFRAEAF